MMETIEIITLLLVIALAISMAFTIYCFIVAKYERDNRKILDSTVKVLENTISICEDELITCKKIIEKLENYKE